MKHCEICKGKGWILSNNESGQEEIQKCDECEIYKSDKEAQRAVSTAGKGS